MAQPKILRGTYASLMLGDGAGPEVFTALCGFRVVNFSHVSNTQDIATRDCADPENVPVRNIIVTSAQWDLTGEGVLNRDTLPELQAADDGQPHNWRLVFTEPVGDLVYQGYYSGSAVMTNFTINSDEGAFVTASITLASDGEWTWTVV